MAGVTATQITAPITTTSAIMFATPVAKVAPT